MISQVTQRWFSSPHLVTTIFMDCWCFADIFLFNRKTNFLPGVRLTGRKTEHDIFCSCFYIFPMAFCCSPARRCKISVLEQGNLVHCIFFSFSLLHSLTHQGKREFSPSTVNLFFPPKIYLFERAGGGAEEERILKQTPF